MLPKFLRVLMLLTSVLLVGIKAPCIRVKRDTSALKVVPKDTSAHEEVPNPTTAPEVVSSPKPQAHEEEIPFEQALSANDDVRIISSRMLEASRILDNILKNHDHSLRPGFGKHPTVVNFDLLIHAFGPLSVSNMEYTMDITFYQTWYDERLRFEGSFENIVVHDEVLKQIWLPNILIHNSKRSREQGFDLSTSMARIYRDGKVTYTARLIIDIGCTLHLVKFPMDSHSCPLSFSSFSYPIDEVIFEWDKIDFDFKNTWRMYQFDFKGVSNKTEVFQSVDGEYLVLTFLFNITRQLGFATFQSYIPSSMTTVLSWISFWIQKDCSPARTSLGITSVLTMASLCTFTRKEIPFMTCVTALDFYIAFCLIFCFCSLIEFAIVTFLTYKRKRSRVPRLRHVRISRRGRRSGRASQQDDTNSGSDGDDSDSDGNSDSDGEDQRVWERLACPEQLQNDPYVAHRPWNTCKWYQKFFCTFPSCHGSTWQRGRLYIHIYRLDAYSRVCFPVAFFIFNVIYWCVCLN